MYGHILKISPARNSCSPVAMVVHLKWHTTLFRSYFEIQYSVRDPVCCCFSSSAYFLSRTSLDLAISSPTREWPLSYIVCINKCQNGDNIRIAEQLNNCDDCGCEFWCISHTWMRVPINSTQVYKWNRLVPLTQSWTILNK